MFDEDQEHAEGYLCMFGNLGCITGVAAAFAILFIVGFSTTWTTTVVDESSSEAIVSMYYSMPGWLALVLGIGSYCLVFAGLFLWREKRETDNKSTEMTTWFKLRIMGFLLVPGLLFGFGLALLFKVESTEHASVGLILIIAILFIVALIPIVTHYLHLKRENYTDGI